MKLPDNYLNIEQHSAAWFEQRLGKVTASRVADAISFLARGGSSAAREQYKLEVLTEILTGNVVEHYVSPAMDFGSSNEPIARASYEMERGVEVERVGLVLHPRIHRGAASPDGLVGDDGLIEIKVPTQLTHLSYFLGEVVPEKYIPQMTWQMACSGRRWCDFVSYDPRLPEEYSLFIVRLERDDAAIAKMEQQVEQFILEVNELAGKLMKYKSDNPKASGVPKAEIPAFQ